MQREGTSDGAELCTLVNRFYQAFDARRLRPDLSSIVALMLPDATIIKQTDAGTEQTDIPGFIKPRQAWFDAGTLDGFWEEETAHQTIIGRNVACRLSWYQKFVPVRTAPRKGCKSFQFVRTQGRWWISCLAWADQPSTLKF